MLERNDGAVAASRTLIEMRNDLANAIKANQQAFNIELADDVIEKLADFFAIIQENNPLLHLVAPMTAEEFAVRHILESLTLLEHLPQGTRFADVGAGAGLPSIPCLFARADLSAVLIESKVKKAEYLREAVKVLGISERVKIEGHQFEEVRSSGFSVVTCRALDRFTEKLPKLAKWSKGCGLLLFGGPTLAEALERQKIQFSDKLMPMSERRYLYIVKARSSR